ncbi:MAG: hypothetical protein MZV64_68985 [Ignavibacteriales bacterium]|nr:hypothetical protein [Ignavibacteriales bacterium]
MLELAEDSERTEVEKFLESKGFSFDNFEYIIDEDDEEDDTTHYSIIYHKKWPGNQCYVRVDADSDEDNYIVLEFSYEEERTFIYSISSLQMLDLNLLIIGKMMMEQKVSGLKLMTMECLSQKY